MTKEGPIGVFDSGYGGLTILEKLREVLPQYDYLYLGDNARAPYGSRSFDVVYQYTRQAVMTLFEQGCNMVVLACNTASAKALRSVQQLDLPKIDPDKRVLGVIRPTVEKIGDITKSRHVGILATTGTILSHSYDMEINKLFPDIRVTGQDCPMWVPLVETFEFNSPGAHYFIQKRINQILERDPEIDTLVLGCTHYPLLLEQIKKYTPANVNIVVQGEYVANSLKDYLQRHRNMEKMCSKNGTCRFLTTEECGKFNSVACRFLKEDVCASRISLEF